MEIIDYLLARKKAGGGSDVTIEQLTATENGTYSEQGIAYSPVVVNVPAPANSYQLKNLPSGTVSTIDDGTALPMPSLKIGIEPAQDLHGYDHPWAGGAGKNLANFINGKTIDANGRISDDASRAATVDPILIESGKSYIFTTTDLTFGIISVWNDDTLVRRAASITSGTILDTSGGNKLYVCIYSGTAVTVENSKPMVRLSGESDTYEPYSNICPISGWTAANVSVSPTTSAEDGTTYTIQFKDGDNPLTVYGGTLDVTSGELTATDAHIASYDSETLPSTWISDRDVYVEGTTPTTGAEVVYKLDNSVTYHLTPTQIRTLVGNNNIWADTGDIIEGKYFRSLV